MSTPFDLYAPKYDEWFLKNEKVLLSELRVVAYFLLKRPIGRTLSVGCGSGLFEMLLKNTYNIEIKECIEPSEMGEIAKKRGLDVKRGYAESLPYPDNTFDTVLINGVLHYVKDQQKSVNEAYRVLKKNGWVIIAQIPAESSYGLLYELAKILGTWDHPYLKKIAPKDPYPIDFVKSGNWEISLDDIVTWMKNAGFKNIEFAQTLMRHPKYSNNEIEDAIEGFDRGDYVAIKGEK
ncbi:MAG: class I SAM-dependent methyltransferase [Sulfolobaceae archaeon]|nr:class I SAM-dependent methyltransferase [Sulfolobaceae archaeon]